MALSTRIQFNTTATSTGAYTIPINPSELELNDSADSVVLQTLDGGPVIQDSFFDSRPVIMRWSRIPKTFSNFPTMLSNFEGYIGTIRFVNYNDIDYRVTPTSWNKMRIGNLETKIQPGGSLRYNVALTMFPEP